jgi:hypothetical protein
MIGLEVVCKPTPDEFLNKEFQKCLGTKISKIVFPIPLTRNPDYVEHTFLFRKEDKK